MSGWTPFPCFLSQEGMCEQLVGMATRSLRRAWVVACVLVLYLAGRAFTDCVRIPGLRWDCCGIVDCGFLCGVVWELDGSSWIALMN